MMTIGEHNWIPFKKYAFYDEKVFNFALLLVRKEALEAGWCGRSYFFWIDIRDALFIFISNSNWIKYGVMMCVYLYVKKKKKFEKYINISTCADTTASHPAKEGINQSW